MHAHNDIYNYADTSEMMSNTSVAHVIFTNYIHINDPANYCSGIKVEDSNLFVPVLVYGLYLWVQTINKPYHNKQQ